MQKDLIEYHVMMTWFQHGCGDSLTHIGKSDNWIDAHKLGQEYTRMQKYHTPLATVGFYVNTIRLGG